MKHFLLRNRHFLLFLGTLLGVLVVRGQNPVKEFQRDSVFNEAHFLEFTKRKKIPEDIKAQVLTALSFYPELKDTKLSIRFRKRTTPLTSRPRIFSIFRKKKNRAYVITISTKSKTRLAPILFKNLPYNAQIGVLGHELGHIAYYKSKNSLSLIHISEPTRPY